MDWTLYWFMLPVATLVATVAMMSGIGGAALFTPFFIIALPLLGPQYPLDSVFAAIGAALFIELFGFTSGFVGYLRRGLIHFPTAARVLVVAAPVAVAGSIIASRVPAIALRSAYAALMLVLAIQLWRPRQQVKCRPEVGMQDPGRLIDASGAEHELIHLRNARTRTVTGIGALLTGLTSVGIGEVTMSQLTRVSKYPLAVAAGTSVLVVIATVAVASITHIAALTQHGGVESIPWTLLVWAAPGVVLGGQIGSRLQGKIPESIMERGIAATFLLIAVAMMAVIVA